MGFWSELMITSRAPRYCFSSEEYKEAIRDSYSRKYKDDDDIDIIEEKLISDWFYLNLSYCDVCEKYSKFENNECSSHNVCVICENVDIIYWLGINPVCSQECYVKYKTISCFDCKNMFFKNSFSLRCSLCCDLLEQKLQEYNAKRYKITRRKKENIVSELLCLNHPIL